MHVVDKANILADLWMNYRTDDDFTDFVEYNDLGLPLAYAITAGIVERTERSDNFINETFGLLIEALNLDADTDYDSLDDMFGMSE